MVVFLYEKLKDYKMLGLYLIILFAVVACIVTFAIYIKDGDSIRQAAYGGFLVGGIFFVIGIILLFIQYFFQI